MDPKIALLILCDENMPREEREEACDALNDWLDCEGFPPVVRHLDIGGEYDVVRATYTQVHLRQRHPERTRLVVSCQAIREDFELI